MNLRAPANLPLKEVLKSSPSTHATTELPAPSHPPQDMLQLENNKNLREISPRAFYDNVEQKRWEKKGMFSLILEGEVNAWRSYEKLDQNDNLLKGIQTHVEWEKVINGGGKNTRPGYPF